MRSGLRKIYLLNKTVDRNTNYNALVALPQQKKIFYFSRMFALPVIELLLLLRMEAAAKQEFFGCWLAYE